MVGWWWTMGVAAVFSPCGVALLPASLAWLGGNVVTGTRPARRTLAAVGAGLAMAAGFTAVVAGLAVGFHAVGALISRGLRPLMLGLGLALGVGGVAVALGRAHAPIDRWLGLGPGGGVPRRSWWSGVVAGTVYALGSLSCTLPLFVAALAPLVVGNWWTTAAAIATMGAGTASVLVGFSVGTVWLGDLVQSAVGRVVPRLTWGLGALVAASGGYLVYYWGWGPGRGIG